MNKEFINKNKSNLLYKYYINININIWMIYLKK